MPIDPQRSSSFDPDGVPTITDLMASGEHSEQVRMCAMFP